MRTAVLILLLAAAAPASAQTRANQIAAAFSKTKSHAKSKNGVPVRKYKEVLSEPWHANIRGYAGHYVSLGGDAMVMDVEIAANGMVIARGKDDVAFEIRNARIEDAVLYGTRVNRDGGSEPFEAGFLKRSARSTPDEKFTVRYGIGILVDVPKNSGVTGPMRVFLEKE